MKRLIYGLILMFSLTLTACSSDEEQVSAPKPTENVTEERTVIKKVYVPEESFDEYDPYNGEITETSSSYWYVYYEYKDKEVNYDGYRVVEIDVPYYDVNKIILAIKPELNNEDFWREDNPIYLGVKFFHRVSFETYMKYKQDKER